MLSIVQRRVVLNQLMLMTSLLQIDAFRGIWMNYLVFINALLIVINEIVDYKIQLLQYWRK